MCGHSIRLLSPGQREQAADILASGSTNGSMTDSFRQTVRKRRLLAPDRMPPVLSPQEVSALTSLSERKVYYLMQEGRLPYLQIGRRRLVRIDVLNNFLGGLRKAPARVSE
jgi:excisionase family DNA binding protein